MKRANLTVIPQVDGLDPADQDELTGLVTRLNRKTSRNLLREAYYDGKQGLKDLGIALPPSFKDVEAVVQWPAKAVNSLSRRNVLRRFNATGADPADLGLPELWRSNRLASKIPNAHTSALKYSTAFAFVTNGDVAAGDPAAMITTRSALDATGVWDSYSGSLRSALEVVARDGYGRPVSMVMHFPGRYIAIEWDGRRWRGFERQHAFGMLAEPLPYLPDDDRPMGRSRISRACMYYTDSAIRTLLRTEIGAEFYNSPQRYALGAEDEAFIDEKTGKAVPAWQVILGRMLTLSRDEDGQLPTVGQFSQQTMQPNVDQLRMIALMFAGETLLSPDSLGIIQDNPESAEAKKTRLDDLGAEIEYWQAATLGPAWTRVVTLALRMQDDSKAARAAYDTLTPEWAPWSQVSEVSLAQASLARVQAVPRLAETTVELKRMGYTPDEIEQIQAELARSQSRASIASLVASMSSPNPAAAVAAASSEA